VIFTFDKAFYVATQPWARWTHNSPMIENGYNKYQQVDPVLRAKLRKEWNRPALWPLILLGILVAGALIYAIRWNRQDHV
jgi:hypothetical protein